MLFFVWLQISLFNFVCDRFAHTRASEQQSSMSSSKYGWRVQLQLHTFFSSCCGFLVSALYIVEPILHCDWADKQMQRHKDRFSGGGRPSGIPSVLLLTLKANARFYTRLGLSCSSNERIVEFELVIAREARLVGGTGRVEGRRLAGCGLASRGGPKRGVRRESKGRRERRNGRLECVQIDLETNSFLPAFFDRASDQSARIKGVCVPPFADGGGAEGRGRRRLEAVPSDTRRGDRRRPNSPRMALTRQGRKDPRPRPGRWLRAALRRCPEQASAGVA
jgi:hypothetical protein